MNIIILGGGISGLSAAWRLQEKLPHAEVTLLEKKNRLGGWIETARAGGFLFERGPRTFSAARSPSLLKLIAEVGLEKDLLFSLPSAKSRYLWHRGKLKNAGSLFLPHAWRLAFEPFIRRASQEETIHAFASRRFGTKIAELFFDPLTLGIFAGDSRQLSLQASFPTLAQMEKEYGSLLLAILRKRKEKKSFPGSLFTLKRGMQSLIEALHCRLRGKIIQGAEVLSLARKNGQWQAETTQGGFTADIIFSALPAHVLSKLMPEMPKITSATLTVVNLGFSKLALAKSGYGYLVPSSEKEEVLGMIFDSEVFGGAGCRLTAMVRAAAERPEEAALDALKRHLGVRSPPDHIECHPAPMAIPGFGLGQKQELLSWEASLKNFYLLGNYLEGPAVEQCIARSEKMI